METHPHLHLFDSSVSWKYLIIGTFPPNMALRQKWYVNYFYGNKGFLWKIIQEIYKDRGYDFFKGSMQENQSEILRWQQDYCVGLSDTIVSCHRKDPMSSDDSDLTGIVYNHALKTYILESGAQLEKIIFTSSSGLNSAFENFRIIMGAEIGKVSQMLVTGLPSPSGSANITFFNTNKEETLGLTDDFYQYLASHRSEHLPGFAYRWEQKKLKRLSPESIREQILIPPSPAGLVKEYKIWRYRQALPENKCVRLTEG